MLALSTNILFIVSTQKPNLRALQTSIKMVSDRPTWPFSKRPSYTRPKPPSPKRQFCLKFLVAAASSRKVKVCCNILTVPVPMDNQILLRVQSTLWLKFVVLFFIVTISCVFLNVYTINQSMELGQLYYATTWPLLTRFQS